MIVEARPRPLGRRERQVAELVAEGKSNKEVATAMGLTEGTVKGYMQQIFAKTRVTSRLELALWVLRQPSRPPSDDAAIS